MFLSVTQVIQKYTVTIFKTVGMVMSKSYMYVS